MAICPPQLLILHDKHARPVQHLDQLVKAFLCRYPAIGWKVETDDLAHLLDTVGVVKVWACVCYAEGMDLTIGTAFELVKPVPVSPVPASIPCAGSPIAAPNARSWNTAFARANSASISLPIGFPLFRALPRRGRQKFSRPVRQICNDSSAPC